MAARLTGVRLGWRLVGPANAPVVCALGGISASRYVCLGEEHRHHPDGAELKHRDASSPDPPRPRIASGSAAAGGRTSPAPGRPLDTHRYRVLSFDYLGGSGETTGPRADGSRSPASRPMIRPSSCCACSIISASRHCARSRAAPTAAWSRLLSASGIRSGPGGCIVLCASDRPHPLATAWRSVQRRDRAHHARERPRRRRAEARARARDVDLPQQRGIRRAVRRPAGAESDRFVFPVERYLMARGNDYAARHRPESFLCLSESIDLHRVDANRIFVQTTAVAMREDQLVPARGHTRHGRAPGRRPLPRDFLDLRA